VENNNEKSGFSYTYSAKEQEELRSIREKYTLKPHEEDKMERVRRLDLAVTQKAQILSLIVGVLGALILGSGMSICMTTFGDFLLLPPGAVMIVGSGIGIIGGVLIGLAYPIYSATLKRERKKIAPEILRLTEELMK